MLSNNHAFALASLNRLEEAENLLSDVHEVELSDRERNTILATKGLIEFRKGNINEGRSMYKKAIVGFKRMGNFYSAAIAATFRAREEILIHSEFEIDALREATNLAKKHEVKELLAYASFLANKG